MGSRLCRDHVSTGDRALSRTFSSPSLETFSREGVRSQAVQIVQSPGTNRPANPPNLHFLFSISDFEFVITP